MMLGRQFKVAWSFVVPIVVRLTAVQERSLYLPYWSNHAKEDVTTSSQVMKDLDNDL